CRRASPASRRYRRRAPRAEAPSRRADPPDPRAPRRSSRSPARRPEQGTRSGSRRALRRDGAHGLLDRNARDALLPVDPAPLLELASLSLIQRFALAPRAEEILDDGRILRRLLEVSIRPRSRGSNGRLRRSRRSEPPERQGDRDDHRSKDERQDEPRRDAIVL